VRPCGLETQTTANVLQSCPLHKRESTWPTESSLGNKLHGTATGAVHHPDWTPNITSPPHQTLKKISQARFR